MICNKVLEEEINETDNYQELERALMIMEDKKRLYASVRRAKVNGQYYTKQTREIFDIDRASKLVGTTITLEDIDGYKFIDVPVKKAEMIDYKKVSINDGEYVLDYQTNMTQDGGYIMGSEDGFSGEGIKLTELSGTVKQNMDDIFNKTVEMDGTDLSQAHKEHLKGIVDNFKNILELASSDVKIDTEFYKSLDEKENTRGDANPKTGRIKLTLGNQKNNTMTEVAVHEVQHVMIRAAIKADKRLEYEILKLREAVREHLVKKYGGQPWRVFLEGKAKDKIDEHDAKLKYEYAFNNKLYPADEFLAYATTHEPLVNALGIMKNVDMGKGLFGKVKETGKWTKLWNKLADQLNNVFNRMLNNNKTAKDLALDMLDTALRMQHKANIAEEKGYVRRIIDKIEEVDDRIAGITGDIKKEHQTYEEALRDKKGKAQQAIDAIWRIKGLSKVRSMILQNSIFSSLTKDMDNKYIAKFYEMFRKSKAFVEKEVVAVKNKTADVLDKTYNFNKLTDVQKGAVKRALVDIDAKVLGDLADIKKYFENDQLVKDEIEELTKDMKKDNVLYAMDQLAELLVHNKMEQKNGYVNAAQIALGEMGSRLDKDIDVIDKVVTLLAIQKLDDVTKGHAIEAMNVKDVAFDRVMELKKKDEAEVLKRAYAGDRMYEVKGAKQDVFKGEKKHYFVKADEMKELVKSGAINTGKHEELSRLIGKDIYVVIADDTDPAFTEGLMSAVQLKSEGSSVRRLIMDLDDRTETEVEEIIESLRGEKGVVKDGSALIPERSGTGDVYDYKIRVPYQDKKDLLGLDDDIVTTIASTISNLTHKQEAMLNNRASLHFLREFYDKNRNNKQFKFIEISKNSTGKFKDYWNTIPYYMKKDIEKSGKPFMIEESLLTDYFGYRDVSLVNAPWIKERKKRQIIAKRLEDVVKEAVGRWKKVIVAFTPATIKGNMLSNMIVATQETKESPITYAKKFRETWIEMNEYMDARDKYLGLKIRKDAGETGLDSEITKQQALMKANPVAILIEDGQYNTILEDVDRDFFNNKGIIEGKIDDMFDSIKKTKTREGLKSAFDLMYIRKGSRIHDSVMKLTNYSDAINKMIILKNKLDRNGKITQKDLNEVDGLHVNYGYLDNRYIKYANDMGALTFTKYMFRVLPAMVRLASRKALTVALTEGGRNLLGAGETPIEQFYNPIDNLANKTGLITDPVDMLRDIFTSPFIK